MEQYETIQQMCWSDSSYCRLYSWLCCDKTFFMQFKNAFKLLESSRQELHASRLRFEPKSICCGGRWKIPGSCGATEENALTKKCCGSFPVFHGKQVRLNLHAAPAGSPPPSPPPPPPLQARPARYAASANRLTSHSAAVRVTNRSRGEPPSWSQMVTWSSYL